MNRRDVLKAGAAGLAWSALSAGGAYVAHAAEPKTYRVGLIGTGWYGKNDLFRLMQVAPVEVVSLCDPDKTLLQGAADMVVERQKSKGGTGKAPRLYGDYREMLKAKDLDIVLVVSPDHWHALHTIAALEAGAHVYCQKPISRDVLEGEAMVAAARKHDKVVQVGTQRKSTPHLIEVKKKIVDSGMLGKVGHVELCCYYHMRANENSTEKPVPDYFDYDLWTGPAPLRPYDAPPNPDHDNQPVPHRRWWRTFNEYGNGIVGDMCIHMLDTARWMLGLGWPLSVTSTGGIYVQKGGKSNISDTQVATFQYPEFDVVWQHRTWGTPVDPDYPWALFIYGEKGVLKASTMRADFLPTDGDKSKAVHFDVVYEKEQYPEDVNEPDIELNAAPATRLHMRDFLAAIESGGKRRPIADIEEGHISTAACILANISMDLRGRPLTYDPPTRQVSGDKEATQRLRREYRKPWQHPGDAL